MDPNMLAAYTVIGLSRGGAFALVALGIVLVYRVTGVLNFANGAMGMFATFVAYQIEDPGRWHMPVWLALVVALAFSVVFGLVLELLVFARLAGRSALVKAIATVGILIALQAMASLIWGNTQYHLPIHVMRCVGSVCTVRIFGVPVGIEQLLVIGVALALSIGLGAFLNRTRTGIAMRASAEDPTAARLLGVSARWTGSLSWVIGSVVATIGAILITPFINFDTVSLTVLVLDALAAALIGGLVSLPLTVVGGFILGLLETYPQIWVSDSIGLPKFIALVVIVAILVVRRRQVAAGGAAQ